jgi:ribosome-associated protein
LTAQEKAEVARRACEAHKAAEVAVLPLRDTIIADYFVIAAGRSRIQVQALADAVEEAMSEAGVRLGHREGYEAARWVLLDYGDVVVHVFSEEERRFYALERLWGEPVPAGES